MKALPDFKRGDTFTASCVYKIDGVPTTLAGKAIAAQIRTVEGALIDALAVAKRTFPRGTSCYPCSRVNILNSCGRPDRWRSRSIPTPPPPLALRFRLLSLRLTKFTSKKG